MDMPSEPSESRPGLDHPHVWMLRKDESYTCLYCEATQPEGFDPIPGRVCEHREWLTTPNQILACVGCGLLAEG